MPVLASIRRGAGYLWDRTKRLFRSAPDREPVQPRTVRFALDNVLDAGAGRLRGLSGQLAKGDLSTAGWVDGVRSELTSLHLAARLAAVGGIEQLTPEHTEAVSAILAGQFGYLDRFAGQVDAGDVDPESDGFAERTASYADAARTLSYEAPRREAEEANGASFERRVLDPDAEHCDGCRTAADDGWVPFGTGPAIGTLQCGQRCRCHVEYTTAETSPDDADFGAAAVVRTDAVLFDAADEPRDERGRWTAGGGGGGKSAPAPNRHGEALAKAFDSNLARTGGLSAEQKVGYGAAAHAVLAAMPETATKRVAANLKVVSWHPDTGHIGEALAKDSPKVRRFLDAGGKVGGAYRCSTKTLYLDGPNPMPTMPKELGGKTDSMRHVYAHEFSHAVDGADSALSKHPDWQAAWHAEVNTTPARLSVYAREDPSEGFAEFGRLVYASGVDRRVIEHYFPACSAYWKTAGIWA